MRMNKRPWDKVIIAYRLEDDYGNSPFYYKNHKVVLPEGYYAAFMNLDRLYEPCYTRSCTKLHLYEYLLNITAQTYDTGEVLFRKIDIISKTKLRRWSS